MKLCWLFIFALAGGQAADFSSDQQRRIEKLENSLLGPCCYSEPVATHRSEIALAMKAEIARLVAEGKSDREILDLYKSRHGLRVLVEPEGARWWWMHIVPIVVTVLALGFVIYLLRKWLRPLPASSQ